MHAVSLHTSTAYLMLLLALWFAPPAARPEPASLAASCWPLLRLRLHLHNASMQPPLERSRKTA
jgi:hypothetical protein